MAAEQLSLEPTQMKLQEIWTVTEATISGTVGDTGIAAVYNCGMLKKGL